MTAAPIEQAGTSECELLGPPATWQVIERRCLKCRRLRFHYRASVGVALATFLVGWLLPLPSFETDTQFLAGTVVAAIALLAVTLIRRR